MCLLSRVTQLVGCLQVKVPRVLRIPRLGPLSSTAYPALGLPLKVKGVLGIHSQVLPTLIALIGTSQKYPRLGDHFSLGAAPGPEGYRELCPQTVGS